MLVVTGYLLLSDAYYFKMINLHLTSLPQIPHPKTQNKIPRSTVLIQVYPEHLPLDKRYLIKAEHHPRNSMQKTDVINKEYITREEAASLLNITLPTLHRYAQKGIVRIYKFGSRSLLKTEELILAIKENKIIKYGRRKYKR